MDVEMPERGDSAYPPKLCSPASPRSLPPPRLAATAGRGGVSLNSYDDNGIESALCKDTD